MATKKFRSPGGGHISIYVPWRTAPIEVPAEGTVEVDDPEVIKVLSEHPDVAEYKQPAAKGESKAKSSKEQGDAATEQFRGP